MARTTNANGSEHTVAGRPPVSRTSFKSGFWSILVVGVAVTAYACYNATSIIRQNRVDARYRPERFVSLAEPSGHATVGEARAVGGQLALRVAVAPVISPEKSLRLYRTLIDYLAVKLDRTPVFLQRGSYAEVNDLVRDQRCDMAVVCTYAFVRGQRDFGMECLVVPRIDGSITYHSLILAGRSSKAQSLLDFRGQRFASADMLSNTGWLYPAVWLKQHGVEAESFFGDHVITGSHDRSILAVATGHVDGAAVDSLVYDQMLREDTSIGQETRVIAKSPAFGMPPIVVPPAIDPALKQQLRHRLLDMQHDPRGQQILAALNIDCFVEPDAHLYDSVRESLDCWENN